MSTPTRRCIVCTTPVRRAWHPLCPSCYAWHRFGVAIARMAAAARRAREVAE